MGRWLAVPPILTQIAPSHCAVPGAPAGVSIALFPELRGDVTAGTLCGPFTNRPLAEKRKPESVPINAYLPIIHQKSKV